MQEYSSTFYSVLPVLSLFILGYFLKKAGFFQRASVQDIKKFVVYITLPCLLFLAFSRIQPEVNLLVIFVIVFILCLVMVYYGKLLRKLLNIHTPYFTPLMAGYETGMIGYAIFIATYGMQNVDRFAVVDLGQLLFVWIVLIGPLIKLRNGHRRSGGVLKMCLTSPVVIGILAGITISFLKCADEVTATEIYYKFESIISLLANLTMPLICIAIGYELKIEVKTLKLTLATILLRIVPQVGLALLIAKFLFDRIMGLEVMYQRALVTMFLLPPPFVYTLFLRSDDAKNQHYLASTLSLHTVVSVIVFIFITVMYR